MSDRQPTSPLQFGLRSFLFVVVVVSVGIFQWWNLFVLSFRFPYISFAFLIACCWLIGQRIRGAASSWDTRGTWLAYFRYVVPLVVVACLISFWLRHRWCTMFIEDNWPLPFPYPDYYLLAYLDWLDSLNPTPPQFLNIHGNLPTVTLHLQCLALSLCAIGGVNLGLACRTTGFFGGLFWRDCLLAASRRFFFLWLGSSWPPRSPEQTSKDR